MLAVLGVTACTQSGARSRAPTQQPATLAGGQRADERNALRLAATLELELARVERELRTVAPQRSDDEESRYRELAERRLALSVQLARVRAALHALHDGRGDEVLLPRDADELARESDWAIEEARLAIAAGSSLDERAERRLVTEARRRRSAAEEARVQRPASNLDGGDRERGGLTQAIRPTPTTEMSKKSAGHAPGRHSKSSREAPEEEEWEDGGGDAGPPGNGTRRIERAVVRADAPPVGVMNAVDARLSEIDACIPAELRSEGFHLEVTTRLSVAGRLVGARFGGPVQLPPSTESCIVDVLRSVHAPPPVGGSRTITIPLWLTGP